MDWIFHVIKNNFFFKNSKMKNGLEPIFQAFLC